MEDQQIKVLLLGLALVIVGGVILGAGGDGNTLVTEIGIIFLVVGILAMIVEAYQIFRHFSSNNRV